MKAYLNGVDAHSILAPSTLFVKVQRDYPPHSSSTACVHTCTCIHLYIGQIYVSYYESGNSSSFMFFPRLHVKSKMNKDMEMEGRKKKKFRFVGGRGEKMREVRRWERARLRLKFEELVFKEEIVWGQRKKWIGKGT